MLNDSGGGEAGNVDGSFGSYRIGISKLSGY